MLHILPTSRASRRQSCALLVVLLFSTTVGRAASTYALSFDGVNDYVTAGAAPGLASEKFTIECWFKRTGAGVSVTTSASGGITAIPLVTKGRGEGVDGDNRDMNYFLGIQASDGVLAADFEEGASGPNPGLNHPIVGKTPVANNVWYHAVATHDGTNFALYLNGALETTLLVNRPARGDSIQHFGIGTALTSTGLPAGFFQGIIDEVRVWKHGRSAGDICASTKLEVPVSACLTAHYALDEGSGNTAGNDCGTGINATLINGPTWVTGYQTLYLAGALPAPAPSAANYGLDLRGTDHVNFGDAGALKLTTFTLELWFRREGAGTTTSGGIVPLIAKGRGGQDNIANRNFNYLFGIRNSDNRLFADFEESGGANHSVAGQTAIANNVWYHAAVSFDLATSTWRLYLNGAPNGTASANSATPNSGSIQQAAIGRALDAVGTSGPEGGFDGQVDDVRIWKIVRAPADIVSDMNNPLDPLGSYPDLVGAWSLNENTGSTANDFNNRVLGSILNNAGAAATDRWVLVDRSPPTVTLLSPANNAVGVTHFPTLKATVADPNSSSLSVAFYGRELYANSPPASTFTIALIPDTQHYVNKDYPNNHGVYWEQTAWIGANRTNSVLYPPCYDPSGIALGYIAFVSHLGDIVQNRDQYLVAAGPPEVWQANTDEWLLANDAQGELDYLNIPNNVTVGNHDITPDGTGDLFDFYFPPSRYTPFSWYGSWMGDLDDDVVIPNEGDLDRKNKNNYELFDVGLLKFLVLHLEMDVPDAAMAWAAAVLEKYPDRRAIITTHAFIDASGNRSSGPLYRNTTDANGSETIWNELVYTHCNVFLVLNGHHSGEAQRTDLNECGLPVIQLCQDYQNLPTSNPPDGPAGDEPEGGNGYLRLLVFQPSENKIRVFTYSPHIDAFDCKGSSQFVLNYDMRGPNFEVLSVQNNVAPGQVSTPWTVFDQSKIYSSVRPYEWYVEVSDGVNFAYSPKYVFQTRNDTFSLLWYDDYLDPLSAGFAVNNARKVVGVTGINPEIAASWQVDYVNSSLATLLTLPAGATQTRGTGIGVSKMVANGNDYESELRAFHSDGTTVGTLPILAYSPVYAYAVNNYATTPRAVGTARASNNKLHACFWTLSATPTITDLVPGSTDDSVAYDVNDLATPQIVGETTSATLGTRPAVWRNGAGSPTILPFPGSDNRGTARGINNNEKIVGWTWIASQNVPHAVRWDYNGSVYTPVVLPSPAGLPANSPSYAFSINNSDVIVGYAYDSSGAATGYSFPPGNLAILWVHGNPYFMTLLIPLDYSVFFQTAYDINDSMDIVGEASYGGTIMGYMMTR